MTDKFELSRRKALLGLGTIGLAGAGAGAGTTALFSDEETFENNTIQAGTQNLIVEAGIVDDSTFDGNAGSVSIESTSADGDPAVGITVSDLKPGDCFTIGVNPKVEGNPGYLAMSGAVTDNSDNVNTEPEVSDDDDLTSSTDSQGTDGELAENMEVRSLGYETGDANNGIPTSSVTITDDENIGVPLTMSELLSGYLYRNDSGESTPSVPVGHGDGSPTTVGGDPTQANVDTDQVTHLVEFCLPDTVGNSVQGDSVTFDLTWHLEQARNNPAPANATEVMDGSAN
ncbi:SipW-dependent-type signal peptide-containing protein [Halobaculum gomorrense]|nr:SipW-dependent-type signal peptide-containing protein [Halobaculum gomorrense]